MPKQPSGGLLEAGLYTHKQFSLYSTYCTVSTTAVCVDQGVANTWNVFGFITMCRAMRRKLCKEPLHCFQNEVFDWLHVSNYVAIFL